MEQVQEVQQAKTEVLPEGERRIAMSYEDFLTAFDDSTHAEWANGEAIIFMPPNIRHQRIVSFLHLLIGMYLQVFRIGELFEAPCAMQIEPDGPMREPDLMFVAAEHANRIGEQRLNGPADLIIEVVSTESVARDRSDKFYEYQAGGVREYWIIDPRPGFARADFWVMDAKGQYRPVPVNADGIYQSTVLPDFKLDASTLLAEKLPEPSQVLASMVGKDAILRTFGLDQ